MPEKNYRVQQLPPTLGIKDPDVRMYLDALTNAWAHRSGDTDRGSPDRFITAGEFKGLATNALAEALSSSIPGGAPGSGGSTSVADVISSMSDEIKKSILYQILGTEYPEINISGLQARIDSAIGQANTLFLQEKTQRENQYESVVESIELQAARLGQAEAAITTEGITRTNKDNALASAINNVWAKIGGNSAVIEDGQLAAVSPSGATATKWDQVQVAVRDPNTGLTSTTSIKEELISYSNNADGTLNSIYSVRAQVTTNGRTIVGGFGLAATAGAGSDQGPRIDFGVRADQFWVGNLSGVGDIPFIINTSPTTVNGVTRPAGVYIKDAFIANGVIDNAKIGFAAIDHLKVGGGEITSMSYGDGYGVFGIGLNLPAGGSGTTAVCYVNMVAGSSGVVISAVVNALGLNNDASLYLRLSCGNDGRQVGFTACSVTQGFRTTFSIVGFDPSPPAGDVEYRLGVQNPTSGPGANQVISIFETYITATGGRR